MRSRARQSWLWIAGAHFLSAGCTDTDSVFVERPFFDDPPAASAGFLGYGTEQDQAAKLTVCGNCHVGMQGEWEETAHADAWATLEASGHAQPFCEGCHSVGELGNDVEGDAGWAATGDTRYHDVQCENCHGPGETHVANPDASQPTASLTVDLAAGVGCAECHSGVHHPFAEEWSQSGHATVITSAAGRAECAGCHRGQGALEAWGVNADYVERDAAEHLPINCGVCHDPHDATNAGQLRFPVETTSYEQHLCAKCHNRRTSPDPTSSHGLAPHAPEADLLQGVAGWYPPDAPIDEGQIRASHGSDRNPALCATCHVARFEVTDEETGEFVFQSTGHLFIAIPCVDGQGIPVGGDCAFTVQARAFAGCADAQCHDETGAASALATAQLEIVSRANDLMDQLLQVDPGLEAAGGEIDGSNPVFTVAEGALFNYNLAVFPSGASPATAEAVSGSAVHNPFLIRALLVASIDAVRDEYGVSPNVVLDWKAELQKILDGAPRLGNAP